MEKDLTIDATDRRLVELLQEEARVPTAELARRLAMAPSAVHQRIRKLEERGVIRGYSARLDPEALERGLLAFVFLRTDEALGTPSVAEALCRLPQVLEVHDIAGEDCYLVKVRVRDTDALHRLLRTDIAGLGGVRSTSSIIVLKTFKETSCLDVAATSPS